MGSGSWWSEPTRVAAHGRPRATQDLDVLIAPTAANARKVGAALAEFGFAKLGADWLWFTKARSPWNGARQNTAQAGTEA